MVYQDRKSLIYRPTTSQLDCQGNKLRPHASHIIFAALSDNNLIAGWCNGNTADSGSVNGGSNPPPAAVKRRVRLAVRTPASHVGSRGSIPLRATTL